MTPLAVFYVTIGGFFFGPADALGSVGFVSGAVHYSDCTSWIDSIGTAVCSIESRPPQLLKRVKICENALNIDGVANEPGVRLERVKFDILKWSAPKRANNVCPLWGDRNASGFGFGRKWRWLIEGRRKFVDVHTRESEFGIIGGGLTCITENDLSFNRFTDFELNHVKGNNSHVSALRYDFGLAWLAGLAPQSKFLQLKRASYYDKHSAGDAYSPNSNKLIKLSEAPNADSGPNEEGSQRDKPTDEAHSIFLRRINQPTTSRFYPFYLWAFSLVSSLA